MTIMHSLYRESGTVTIDEETCNQCGQCARICPAEVLTMENGHVRINEESPFGCIACGHCMMVCPEGSVKVRGRGIQFEDLLPLPPQEARATADELDALMKARRSVRRFREKEVPLEILERIVEMAASAPMGIPPWDVGCILIRGRDKVQELAEGIVAGYAKLRKILPPWMLTLLRPFFSRPAYEQFRHFILPLAKRFVESRQQGRDEVFHNAPAVLIFHHSPYAEAVDAAIACTYAMLAAESVGLGSTIIGSAPPVLQRDKELCQKWGIPAGHTPSLALIVGYPAVGFKRAIQRHFTDVAVVE